MQICPVCKERLAVYRGKLLTVNGSYKFLWFPKIHKYWLQRVARPKQNQKIYPFASCRECLDDDIIGCFTYYSNGFFRTLNVTGVENDYNSYELIRITPALAGLGKNDNVTDRRKST